MACAKCAGQSKENLFKKAEGRPLLHCQPSRWSYLSRGEFVLVKCQPFCLKTNLSRPYGWQLLNIRMFSLAYLINTAEQIFNRVFNIGHQNNTKCALRKKITLAINNTERVVGYSYLFFSPKSPASVLWRSILIVRQKLNKKETSEELRGGL